MRHQDVALEDYMTMYEDKVLDVFDKAMKAKEGERQPWHPLPNERPRKIWSDYSKYGIIRDERGLDRIGEDFVEKIITLHANTVLMGHTPEDPRFVIEDSGLEYDEELADEKVPEYVTNEEDRMWRISDYGLEPLQQAAMDILSAQTPEEKLLACDRVLNVAHQRSDLAAMFVRGGRKFLTQLAEAC